MKLNHISKGLSFIINFTLSIETNYGNKISFKYDVPQISPFIPKYSKMVASVSAKLSLVPRFSPTFTFCPIATKPTYSLEWSVDSIAGSHLWSATINVFSWKSYHAR